MSDPISATMPHWISRAVGACLLVGMAYAGASVALATSGGPHLAAPTNALISIALATAIIGLIARGCTAQILARVDQHADRNDRRLTAITNGMVEHGIVLDQITGEIPRVRPLVTACPHVDTMDGYARGYADGAARKPMEPSGTPGTVIQMRGQN